MTTLDFRRDSSIPGLLSRGDLEKVDWIVGGNAFPEGKKLKVAILGGSGMLGSTLVDLFSRSPLVDLVVTTRNFGILGYRKPNIEWRILDCELDDSSLQRAIAGCQWIVNAIGCTKPMIDEKDNDSLERAIAVNVLFPFRLAKVAAANGARVLQIATDCVYSGTQGHYKEDAPHDAHDVYGKTKSLGEVHAEGFTNLRCSIIGPEVRGFRYLFSWLTKQEENAVVQGYTNHLWNGLTTLHFANICHALIWSGLAYPSLIHIVPDGVVTKFELLEYMRENFRPDITVKPTYAEKMIDRTLETQNESLNGAIWNLAGYVKPPTVKAMIKELANWINPK